MKKSTPKSDFQITDLLELGMTLAIATCLIARILQLA